MPLELIRSETMPLLDRDPENAGAGDAQRSAATVRTDYERLSRWGLGLGAGVAVELGIFVLAGMVDAVGAVGAVSQLDVMVMLVAVLLAVGGGAVLMALWASGRRLSRSAQRWLRRSHEASGLPRTAVGWLGARIVNIELRVFLRIATASLAVLTGIGGVALFGRDLADGGLTALSVGALVMGLVALAAGCGQMGGVLRHVTGLAAADPVWAALRGADRR